MANTPDPRDFYRVSRAVLMPSLWRESLGRVAIEAMANGIPVLASDRGALPETLGNAGFVFTIPDRCAPASMVIPTSHEVAPWVATIERLWTIPRWRPGTAVSPWQRRGAGTATCWPVNTSSSSTAVNPAIADIHSQNDKARNLDIVNDAVAPDRSKGGWNPPAVSLYPRIGPANNSRPDTGPLP
jgi:hypothetical protein